MDIGTFIIHFKSRKISYFCYATDKKMDFNIMNF